MKLAICALLAVAGILLPVPARPDPGVVARYVPLAESVGESRLDFLFWDIYDARLYAPGGRWRPAAPYALSITYLRSMKGADIADRSAEEIRRLGFGDDAKLEEWRLAMTAIFPDVEEGDVLTGVRDQAGRTLFYKHDMRIGTVEDPVFADWFFGIWLNERTSEPSMRRELLGTPAD